MIRLVFIGLLCVIGLKAAFAVATYAQDMNARRVLILEAR